MTQANDLPSRMSRAEDNIIDLRLAASALLQAAEKNSADIAALIEVSRRNSELGRQNSEQIRTMQESTIALQNSQGRMEETIRSIQATNERMEETIRSIQATNERMDRLFDYLIRRDQGRSDSTE